AVPVEFCLIRWPKQRDKDAPLSYHAVGTRKRVFTDSLEHNIDIFGYIFEFLFGVIDRHVRAKLFEKILITRRCGREHFRATQFRKLNRETADPAGAAVNQNTLSGT